MLFDLTLVWRYKNLTDLKQRSDKEQDMKKKPGLFLGTSGWNYKAWKNDFYAGVKQKNWLQHYAGQFNALEINATFYRLQKESTLQGWLEQTPQDFVFAVKGSRYVTHVKKLKDPQESVLLQKENLTVLQPRLGAVLWQMPAALPKDLERLQEFSEALQNWPGTSHVLEFRHSTWFENEVHDLLLKHGLVPCISDAADWPRWDAVGEKMAYIRLHGDQHTYHSWYSEQQLHSWAGWIKEHIEQGRVVHVYFDNTDGLAAPNNAKRLQQILSNQFAG